MRIAVIELHHQPSTFNPVPTGVEHFEENGVYWGAEVLERVRGFGRIGGLMQVAEERGGITLVPILKTMPMPGGRPLQATLDRYLDRAIAYLRAALPVDGVFLSMHGGTVSETEDDVCGLILARVKETTGQEVPVVAVLDHHGNVSNRMVEIADLIEAFSTQPHDQLETGRRAAEFLIRLIDKEIHPTAGFRKIPMVAPQDRFLTSEGPMKAWFDRARALEKEPGVLTISLFPMQPWLDAAHAGWSVVVYTESDPALAERLAAELADHAWSLRERFWDLAGIWVEDALEQAEAAPAGPIILSDTGDSVFGGASGDSTCILGAMLRRKITKTAFVPILDRPALDLAIAAGVGAEVTLEVGGKVDRWFTTPITVTGRVAAVSHGLQAMLPVRGFTDIGRTARIDLGAVQLVLAEFRSWGLNLPILYTRLGLDIADAGMIVAKTASNFHFFDRWRKGLIRVNSPGLTQSNLRAFEWTRARRPLWPLDDLPHWSATGAE
jgi:microcystin degradation protein MlrC